MTKFMRDNLLMDLKQHVVEVHFTKVNGEKRVMHATLLDSHLPSNTDLQHLNEMHHKPENLNTIAVWDMQNGGWRSFRIESVEYAQILDAY
jgi:hypothetical protein